jgi:serine/threonine-protein kinase
MIDRNLAHFRVTDKLGEGGMGTVYRARDTKLGRDVALKLLPEAFANDAARMARFAREAQMLASLNHPNVAGIHSVEEAPHPESGPPVHFLVMELVEGETLQERIERGRLSFDEALRITLQIATGLEEAHERGIIHRDLKPANVKLTPDKQVKILDFGLAKAFDPDAGSDSIPPAATSLSLSPTMTRMETQAGMLLGTAAYMSPEQARGEAVDRRADIWALGVVLMEMLTGEVMHRGKTVSDTLASVLARDPAWNELPADTPRVVRTLLERCLEKEARNRLRDVGEARIAIERFLESPEDETLDAPSAGIAEPGPAWKRVAPWAVAVLMALALIVTFVVLRPEPPAPEPPTRLNLVLPPDLSLFGGFGASVVRSPTEQRLAYTMFHGTRNEIRVRALDQWEGTLLAEGSGQDRPYQPFFSPDGKWIGFVTPVELRKVPVGGGTPIKLCDVDRARGVSWGPDGTIVFSPSPRGALMQVPDKGGEPQPFTELDEAADEQTHRWPQWLPGGQAVLFTSHTQLGGFEHATVEVFIPASGERRVVHQGGSFGRYVELGDGKGVVVYANGDSLFGIPYDVQGLKATGSSVPLVQGVTVSQPEGSSQYDIAADGSLVYGSGNSRSLGNTVVWIDRDGEATPLWDEMQFTRSPRISPDGTRVAFDVLTEGEWDIWVYDVERGVPTRLTFQEGNDRYAAWSPDGAYVYYSSIVDGKSQVFRKLADGSGKPESVYVAETDAAPLDISPDGRSLAFAVLSGGDNLDVALLPLDEDAEPRILVNSEFPEFMARFSPNGRWVAYVSLESGAPGVYVIPVEGGGKWQISADGAYAPLWSADGRELFFRRGNATFVVDVETEGPRFRAGRARELWSATLTDTDFDPPLDVTRDGRRFVAFKSAQETSPDTHEHLNVVLNWRDELRAIFGE